MHGDTGKCDAFNQCAIGAFNRKTLTAVENTVGDRNILKASIGFGAKLDASVKLRWEVGLYLGPLCFVRRPAFPRAIQHGSHLIGTGDITSADRDVLGCARITQREGAFRTNSIIPGRVDTAIGDAHVAATIDIDAVAVGIDP